MGKKIIHTEHAPAAVGPYSQANVVGNLVFTAGQIPLIPETGKMLDGDVAAQADLALKNLTAVLEAAGSSLDNVVKTTVFLNDINDFVTVNGVYAKYFTKDFPARSAVQVAALPLGALVEIEAVAVID